MLVVRTMLLAVACVLAAGGTMGAEAMGADQAAVLVEAEAFAQRGGWVVDQQFMDEMGSPFLLAHGLGRPVADATTKAIFPNPGTYHVWVRTRDWVATWGAPGAPGKFQVLIDGTPLKTTFGTEGAKWHWQAGGTVAIAGKSATIALHDLTGFEGRCEAVAFCADPNFRPPDDLAAMRAWRRQLAGKDAIPIDAGEFDLVVVGGGIAGTAAALSAARLDVKVALVQDRPVLGGNNSSEVRVWLGGKTNFPPYPRIGDIVRELDQKRKAHYGPSNTADLYEDDRKIALVRAEKNITLLLGHRGNEVAMKDGRIAAVIAEDIVTGKRLRLGCRQVADCTGHGVIGALAGAEFQMTLKGHMGRCNLWNIADTGKPVSFPRCPWALDLADKPFPGRKGGIRSLGAWFWESGFDHDPIVKGEYIRDWNFRAMYGAFDALKNVEKLYGTYKLNWSAYISGPRESRRLVGDVMLTKEDILGRRQWPDACVPCTWSIDLHYPEKKYVKGFEGDAFISYAHHNRFKGPYWLPYRCLYSRNIPNLFMAGRDISVTHEALGTVRVMRTCGMMGEVVGMAASICRKYEEDPRGVYAKHLAELKELMLRGTGKPRAGGADNLPSCPVVGCPVPTPPAWLASAGENLARGATIKVSSNHPGGRSRSGSINDGDATPVDNGRRWLSDVDLPHQVKLSWKQPVTISAVRIVSGYRTGDTVIAPLEAFSLQYDDEGKWKGIPGATVAANTQVDWSGHFAPVRTRALRLTVTAASGGVARIWECEAYTAPKPTPGVPKPPKKSKVSEVKPAKPGTAKARPDISSVPPDLVTPKMVEGKPVPGKRVRQVAPDYIGTDVHHALYLPVDWRPGGKYPVLVEYAGNGPCCNRYGDISTGKVEGSNLGYGISGGKGFLWLCLPYVNTKAKSNQTQWWGDVDATVEYAKKTVPSICAQYGGDPSAVVLIGFSRGAIGCNYIGLHDPEIAKLWRAFIPYSHYDGVRRWGYAESDRAAALVRLKRLAGRPQFICMENSIDETRKYLAGTGAAGNPTFMVTPFRNHNDQWAHRDTPERRALRKWLAGVLAER